MKILTWRNTALALAVLCAYQRWDGCAHDDAATAPAATAEPRRTAASTPTPPPSLPAAPSPDAPAAAGAAGRSFHGFTVPAWALRLAPQRGETMRAYRDRVLPLAELAVAPQRTRVARMRDDFAQLDAHQRAELDAAVAEAAAAIQARVTAALASGALRPAALKPMTGVALVRDVLDIVDRGNTRFVDTLTADQREQLASHRFDFADYLAFTARWEDALHALD